jgi:hypothetical protein
LLILALEVALPPQQNAEKLLVRRMTCVDYVVISVTTRRCSLD